jgi:hypothetical protein
MPRIIDPQLLDPITREWLETRPHKVREAFLSYPPGLYMVKPGAPYTLTGPGCKVVLLGHNGDGEAIVVVTEPTQASLDHAKLLAARHGKPLVDVRQVKAYVDAKWLELIELAQDINSARIPLN